ncbi:MAG: polysaccharide deacetylase family protein [Vicinamibacterales bacterium]
MLQVDRFASVFLARPLLTSGLVPVKSGIPILLYHSVSDDPEPGVSPYYRLATSPARFREQMEWLRASGHSVVGLPDAVRRLSGGRPVDERLAVITFDDGFRDFYTHAWSVLSQFGFTATMFLPTGFIGRDRQSFKGRECLTWSEVRELQAAGATFGSHTVSHPKLHGLPWPDVRRELQESRATIEDALGVTVDTFAYPYAFPQEDAAFANRFTTMLADHGYVGAVTTVIGRAGGSSEALCLERLPVNQADDRALFTTKLAGAYDWLGAVQLMVRHAKRRVRHRRVS